MTQLTSLYLFHCLKLILLANQLLREIIQWLKSSRKKQLSILHQCLWDKQKPHGLITLSQNISL